MRHGEKQPPYGRKMMIKIKTRHLLYIYINFEYLLMKIIKASQLIYSISTVVDTEIEITAIRVNRLCSNMRLKDIYCELRQIDFEDLMMEFPNVISMNELEVKVEPTPEFKYAIQSYFRFDSNLLSNKELLRYWEETDE